MNAGTPRVLSCVLISFALLAWPGLGSAEHAPPGAPRDGGVARSPSDERGDPISRPVARHLQRLVNENAIEAELGGDVAPAVARAAREAYARSLFEPVWTPRGARSLERLAGDLSSFGVAGGDLAQRRIRDLARHRFGGGDPAGQARADLRLTVVWLRIAAAVSGGLSDAGASPTGERRLPAASVLSAAIIDAGTGAAERAILSFEPSHPQYRGLKRALSRYRAIREAGGWPFVPAGDLVRFGERDERVPVLRRRLVAEGYTSAAPPASGLVAASELRSLGLDRDRIRPETLFDGGLAEALRAFQADHGLDVDGILGPDTLGALNESVGSKIERIVDSLGRWRAFDDNSERYVWANIPSFRVEGWNAGRREIAMKSIVGKPSRPTPEFSDMIELMVPNPRWYVPVSIARRDKAPKLARDPGYAASKGFLVFDRVTGDQVSPWTVDWTDPDAAVKYRLVQKEGEGNALGRLKILFPNRHSVYMHGTPDTSLFEQSRRAYSSGCVRLSDPVAMARWLSSHDDRVRFERIEAALQSGRRQHLRLSEPTPVHITYFTVTVGDDGRPEFWRDIYDRLGTVSHVARYTDPAGADWPSAPGAALQVASR